MPRPVATAGDAVRDRAATPAPTSTTPAATFVVASLAAVVLVALAIAAVVGPGGATGPGVGEAVVQVHGEAVVVRADGTREVLRGRGDLGPGDSFTVRTGRADLELAHGVELAALAATGSTPATVLVMGEAPVLESGELLVSASAGITVRAGDGDVAVASDAVARLTRTAALRVGLYQGSATVSSAGTTRQAPTHRRVEVVGAGEVTRPQPIVYSAADPWDRTHLGPALSLDRELGAITDALRADRVEPAALPERVRRVLPKPPAAATLVDLVAERSSDLDNAVAVAVAGSGSRPFVDAWQRGVAFHDAGAGWGLVALDLSADPDAIVDALLASLEGDPVPTTPAPPLAVDGRAEPTSATTPAATDGAAGSADDAGAATGGSDEDRSDRTDDGAADDAATGTAPTPPVGSTPAVPTTPAPTTPSSPVGPVLQPLAPVLAPLNPVLEPVTGTLRDVGGGLVETVGGLTAPLDPVLGGVTDPLIGEGGVVPGLLGGLLGP